MRARVEFADRFHRIAKKLDANGPLRFWREKIHDAAAHRELPRKFYHFRARVSHGGEMPDQFFVRNFRILAKRTGQR